MKIDSWPRIFSCPMYSSSARGRSARSTTSSVALAGLALTTRWSSSFSIMSPPLSLALGQELQRLPNAVGHGEPLRQTPDHGDGFLLAVTEGEQRMQHIGGDRRRPMDADGAGEVRAELVLQFE